MITLAYIYFFLQDGDLVSEGIDSNAIRNLDLDFARYNSFQRVGVYLHYYRFQLTSKACYPSPHANFKEMSETRYTVKTALV